MTLTQERSINLALNMLHVGFFECPKQFYEYFVNNDEWALLMAASGVNAVDTPPKQIALVVLQQAVARQGFFADMTDFTPPTHYCSFLSDKIRRGERDIKLQTCQPGLQRCPYATFEHLKASK
jgi:hypothetical protein